LRRYEEVNDEGEGIIRNDLEENAAKKEEGERNEKGTVEDLMAEGEFFDFPNHNIEKQEDTQYDPNDYQAQNAPNIQYQCNSLLSELFYITFE